MRAGRAKQQVVFIHGGETWKPHETFKAALRKSEVDRDDFMPDSKERWHKRLQADFGRGYEVFRPDMPCAEIARYELWKIWFEKMLRFIDDGPVFIGHSLGGIFLAKYFAENPDRKGVCGLFLVAPPYADARSKAGMADFILPRDMSRLAELGPRIRLYFSKNDPIVSVADSARYAEKLPDAVVTIFEDKGHFIIRRFPELIRDVTTALESLCARTARSAGGTRPA